MSEKIRVAILQGGISSEREISLLSAKNVAENLPKDKYQILTYDPKTDLGKMIADKEKIDVVFPVLHGHYGEDGTIQGFLELLKLPYVGSGVLASAMGINKLVSLQMFEKAGIPVPHYQIYTGKDVELNINFPCVVKPNTQGSSVGITICRDPQDLEKALPEALKYDEVVLIEDYLSGRELTVGVLGDKDLIALPVVEIRPKREFFDYQAKYDGSTAEIVPAPIPEKIKKLTQKYGLAAHRALDCRGFSRTDMIWDGKEDIRVIEINTIPGLTKESLLPKAARAAGIEFSELLDRLIQLALEAHKHVRT